MDYALEIKKVLAEKNIRVKLDDRDEKLSYKMRESQKNKVPYTLIIGDKESESHSVSYRLFGHKETETLSLDDFVRKLEKQIKERCV